MVIVNYWKALIPDIQVIGHYQVSNYKTCPNFDVDTIAKLAGKKDDYQGYILLVKYRNNINWI